MRIREPGAWCLQPRGRTGTGMWSRIGSGPGRQGAQMGGGGWWAWPAFLHRDTQLAPLLWFIKSPSAAPRSQWQQVVLVQHPPFSIVAPPPRPPGQCKCQK